MLMWGTTGRSTWLAPGMPASCSRKKHTALPRSAHDPPPNDTTTSMPSRRAWSTACCTSGTGTCDWTSSNVDSRVRFEQLRHPLAVRRGHAARGRDEQRRDGPRAPSPAPAAGRASRRRTPAAAPAPCGSTPRSFETGEEVVVAMVAGHAVPDEPLVAEALLEGFVGHRQEERGRRRSGWRGPASRLASWWRTADTSIVVVMTSSGRPRVSKNAGSGASSPGRSPWAAASSIERLKWSRFMVTSKTRGVPASSAARRPTRCTWMWSGWP